MSAAVEIFGFFVTALGLLMLGVTLTHSSWRVSTVHGNVITTNTIFENLWYSCATDSLGVYNCWEFPSMLALSGYIQACRALMISAILLGFLGLFLGMVGLHCTNIGSLELSRKTKLAATAGALHILAGPSVVLLSLPQVSAGWWPSPGTPSTSPGTSSTPCIPEPSTSWALPSTWAGAPPCSPSWAASASSPTAAALRTKTPSPASGFPTRPRRCLPKASLPACLPQHQVTRVTVALASTGKRLTCRRPGHGPHSLPTAPSGEGYPEPQGCRRWPLLVVTSSGPSQASGSNPVPGCHAQLWPQALPSLSELCRGHASFIWPGSCHTKNPTPENSPLAPDAGPLLTF
ncbi:claudin-15 isoform X1 [Hippopotamus amphibius kiboko]|uniref:claudin-15 isoform X1 n=1 Tax=Hippopotamus amphibius kiboko TaxID=575201 RepID=UPI002598F363|nr:claudin-15 isoform X1 [Hippopotamus amphibius kiboko]